MVSDQSNGCIRKIDVKKDVVSTFVGIPDVRRTSDGDVSVAKFGAAKGLAVGLDNTIYTVENSVNVRIRKITRTYE